MTENMSAAGEVQERLLVTQSRECRACLKIGSSLEFVNIHRAWASPWDAISGIIADDLVEITNIQLSKSDKHSDFICAECCTKLFNALQFISMVKKSDDVLRQREWPKPIQVDKNINNSVIGEGLDVEIKQEVVSDEEYDNANGTEESVVFNENYEGANATEESDRPELALDIKIEPEEIMQPAPIQIVVNGTVDDKIDNQSLEMNGCRDTENEEYLDVPMKQEPMSEDEEQVPSDLPLECLLCAKTFHSVSGLKAHVIAQHSYKTVKRKIGNNPSPEKKSNIKHVCATCRRSFETSTDLMVHETCHNKSVCYCCHRKFDTFEQLLRHRKKCKNAVKDVSRPKTLEDVIRPISLEHIIEKVDDNKSTEEYEKCSMCDEKFSDGYYMKIHHEIHHSNETKTEKQLEAASTQEESRTQGELDEKVKVENEELQTMFEQSENIEDKHGKNNKKDHELEQSNQAGNTANDEIKVSGVIVTQKQLEKCEKIDDTTEKQTVKTKLLKGSEKMDIDSVSKI